MPDIKKNNSVIYNALVNEGFSGIGANADEFAKLMEKEDNRKVVYDALTKSGYSGFGKDLNEFSSFVYAAPAQDGGASRPTPGTKQVERVEQPARTVDPQAAAEGRSLFNQMTAARRGTSILSDAPQATQQYMEQNPVQGGAIEWTPERITARLTEEQKKAENEYNVVNEYERRWQEYQKDIDADLSGPEVDAKKKWLDDNNAQYRAAKQVTDEIEGRFNLSFRETDKERLSQKQREIEERYPAVYNPGGQRPDPANRLDPNDPELKSFNAAHDIYDESWRILNKGSKYDDGYDKNWLGQMWTAAEQFASGTANRFDIEEVLTLGGNGGAAKMQARKIGDKQNGIINATISDMGYKDEDIEKLINSVNESGAKLEPIAKELDAAAAELTAMQATIEDMRKRGADDSNVRAYIRDYNKKIKAYNDKVKNEFTPLYEEYQKYNKEYGVLQSAIDTALENGLSDGDRAVLDALGEYISAQRRRRNDVSVASAAGEGFEQTVEYMFDFFLTGGIAKAGEKAATKLAAKSLMRKMFGEKGAQIAARGIIDAVVAAERTAVLIPRNIQSYGENLVEMTGGKDNLGRYQFDRSRLNAAFNTLFEQYVGYWTEGFGEYLVPVEQRIFRGITKSSPKTAIGKTLSQYRGVIGQYLDYAKFDGQFNEMFEEVVNSAFDSAAGWMSNDRIGNQDALKDFVSGEQLATTFLSFLPLSVVNSAVNIKAYNKMKNRYNESVAVLNPFLDSGAISREELEGLVSNIEEKTPEEIKDSIVSIADKARASNGGSLPQNFTQSLMGYVEGSFAMSMNNEQWENSQEKIGVVNAYTEQYANPDERNAYDLAQLESEARAAAMQAGFDEDMLDLDSYSIARHAQALQQSDPQQAQVLLGYAVAKSANQGLKDGYDEETKAIFNGFESDVRANLDVNGSVITATLPNGRTVYIDSKDARVTSDGKITTPTGNNGLVSFRYGSASAPERSKADTFSNAQAQLIDDFILFQEYDFTDKRKRAFEQAQNTISPAGKARALNANIGNTVFFRSNGIYEPMQVDRLTQDNTNVVVSGDPKFLSGLATMLGLQSPGGQSMELPIETIWPMLATNDDGSLATNQPEAEVAQPAEAQTSPQAQSGAPMLDGRPIGDIRLDEENGWAYFTYQDDPNGMMQVMDIDEFRQKTGQEETPAQEEDTATPAEQPQAPAVEEAPVEEAPKSKIPVDKDGNKIYDAHGVEPIDAYDDMYSTPGLTEEDVDEWVIAQSDEAEKNRNPKIKKGQSLADWGAAKAEANRVADFWKQFRDIAEERAKERKEARRQEAERQKEIEKYGVDTRNFDLTPQTVEEAVADYLGNNDGIIDLDDAKKEVFGKSGRIPSELFRHVGNGGILTKKGGRTIADVANDIVGEYEGQLSIEQDAVRDLIIDYLARYTKTEMRDMIFNNRLNDALAEVGQQNGASEEVETAEVVEDMPAAEESVEVQYNRKGRTLTAKYTIARDEDGFIHINSNGSSANMRPEEIGLTAEQMAGPKEEYNDEAQWKDVVDTINEVGIRVSEAVIRPDGTVEVTDTSNGLPPFSDAISKKIVAKFFHNLFTQEQIAEIEATEIPIPASEAVEEAPEGTAVPEVEEPVAEPAEPETATAEEETPENNAPESSETPENSVPSQEVERRNRLDELQKRVSIVQQHPANLRAAYESGDAERIASAEKAMSDFINSSDSILLLRGTENVAKDRRKKADNGSAEYKLQDFILKAIKKRIGQLDKAAVKAFDDARAVYEDRFTAEKDALESAIAYFQGELETAQELLDNVSEGANELYVSNLKNRVSSAKRYLDVLTQELNRFNEEEEEKEPEVKNEPEAEVKEPEKPAEKPAQKAAKASTDEKIEDFGEKIGGARKDTYRAKIRDAVKLTAKDLKTLKDPDKILPRKKIISLMADGSMSKEDGLTLLSLNMAVRSLSDSLGMKTLVLMKYRDLAAAWEKGEALKMEITDADIDFMMDQKSDRVKAIPNIREKERNSLDVLFQRVYNDYRSTYEALNYPAENRALKSAYIRYGSADGRYWVVGSPSSYRGWPFPTMEQAVAKMKAEYPEIKDTENNSGETNKGSEDKIGNLLITKDDLGYYRIKSRSIPGKIYLSKKFYNKKEAEQFLKDNAASLVDREQKMVDALLGSNIGMVQREGIDYRNGKDVTPDQMLETFGFRGVEFGNWVPQAERQEYLNKTYDAIMDFCDIVGISPKAFSLGGRLGLAFGARGHSRALAHYEPMKEVINLTRMKGAGSLAHEWFHALDNYLAKQKTGNTSDMATDTKNVVREEMAQAFRDFVGAMNQLDYSKRSRRAGDYWGEVWERAARLFESYVYNELANKSVVSPLLVRKDTLFDDVQSEDNSASSWPYPSISENEQMKPFFDKLFDTIEEKVGEDGNVLLFRDGDEYSNNNTNFVNDDRVRSIQTGNGESTQGDLGAVSGDTDRSGSGSLGGEAAKAEREASSRRLDVLQRGLAAERDKYLEESNRNGGNGSNVADSDAGRDSGRKSASEAAAEELVRLAKENGFYIEPSELRERFGEEYPKQGYESITLISTDGKVFTKLKDPFRVYTKFTETHTPFDVVNEVIAHNIIFKDTPYRFLGVTVEGGRPRLVLQQYTVKHNADVQPRQMSAWFAGHGFDFNRWSENASDKNVRISDVDGKNVLVSPDGRVRAIDPMIHFLTESNKAIKNLREKLAGVEDVDITAHSEKHPLMADITNAYERYEYESDDDNWIDKAEEFYNFLKDIRPKLDDAELGTIEDDVADEIDRLMASYPNLGKIAQYKDFFDYDIHGLYSVASAYVDKPVRRVPGAVSTDEEANADNLLSREDPTAALESGREFTPEERRISAAEREVTNATLDRMSEEMGIKINRVGRSQMPRGHKSDKGYYNPSTGEMTICMDNVTDERDAIATVLHETVGHHGLRKLFGDRFNDAMARIYAALDQNGKTWVNGYIARHPNADNTRAVEEYLSHLAESGDFKNTVWDNIKRIIGQIVDALFGTNGFLLTDNELNYILRASYENLKNPNWLNTVEGRAFDTLLKRQLGINETDPNKPTDPQGPDAGNLYRDGDSGVANDDYNREMERNWNKALTENQDADRPVKIGMDKVMKEKGIKSISEDEDYLTRHNIASSRAESEAHEFELFRFTPLMDQVRAIQSRLLGRKATDADRQQAYERILDYMYAVSGLERNASKNAEIEQAKQAKLADAAAAGITDPAKLAEIEKKYEDMKRDWSGLTSLMGMDKDNWRAAETAAQAMIDAFTREVGDDAALDELWNRVRACTDFSLEHAYQHGLLTREEFERLHGTANQPRMWDFYLPLRGFSETTTEEQFSYENFTNPSRGNVVVKKMNGRWTQADNPLANILNIAETEIVQGNDNWAKQALYRFTLNAGDNTLLSASEPWYVKNPATGKWSLAFPGPGETLEEFEERMKALRALDDPLAKKGRRGLKLENIMANKAHRNEHAIHLKVGGIDKMIWVNGNPALAKAVSGIVRAQNLQWLRRASRVLSNLFTTYSLDFTAKNLIRDTVYSNIALYVKEDKAYRHQYRKNWIANFGYGAFAFPMVRLSAEWDSGMLQQKEAAGTLTKREQDFLNFMRDGGQTGYTIINSVSQIKKDLEKQMRSAGGRPGTVPILGWYAKAVKTLNEGFELLTRFTAYQTSRDMGRSGQRAASDAKEISVNFNRRGAQSGDGVWGNIAAYLGATHYFYNAGVQGFDNFLGLFKKKPVKMSAITAGFVMMGVLTPLINSMLAGLIGGGDGDDDWYWNLPEWVRRNNLVIGTGKWYVAIPLPVEFRAPYGIGDIAGAAFAYDKYPNRHFGNVAGDLVATASGILPVNPIEGYTSNGNLGDAALRAVAPDATMFFVDWATNRDYTGRPLWKENPFSDTVPKSQGAYASTPKGIVAACQKLAEVSNGAIDIAPGVVRDFMNNYGGGFFRAAEDVSKLLFTDAERPRRWDNVPFFSGFTGHIDEDRSNSFAQGALYDYKKLSEDNVKSMNAILNTDDVTSAVLYDNPESLYEREGVTIVQKAKIKRMLDSKDYALGKMYREGMNNSKDEIIGYEAKVSKNGSVRMVPKKKPGVNQLRQDWKALRDQWAKMPDKTEEQKSAKAEMDLKVQEAWHLYYDAMGDLAEKLMDYEYNK